MREINLDEHGNMRVKLRPLKYKHFMGMFKEAHAMAFTEDRNMKGWQKEGILPKFDRHEYWNLLKQIAARQRSIGSSQGSCGNTTTIEASTPPSEHSMSLNLDITSRAQQVQLQILQAGSTPVAAANVQEHNSTEGTSSLTIPTNLQHVVSCTVEQLPSLQKIAALPKAEVLTYYMKALDVLKKVNVQQTARVRGEDDGDEEGIAMVGDDTSRKNKITARDIWGRPGSVTGREALEILRAKEVERKRLAHEKAARDEAREHKRRRAIVDSVTKGAHLLTTIGNNGPSILNGLLVGDLKALLTHNDPENGEPKGNKAELLSRVKMLDSVKIAMATYESTKNQTQPPPNDPRDTCCPLGAPEDGFAGPEVSLLSNDVAAVR